MALLERTEHRKEVQMTQKELSRMLAKLDACGPARKWIKSTRGTPAEMWLTCERGDWLLWLAAKAGVRRQDVALAACACARLSLQFVPEWEARPLQAIEISERWARNETGVLLKDVHSAADAAAYAAYTAYADE